MLGDSVEHLRVTVKTRGDLGSEYIKHWAKTNCWFSPLTCQLHNALFQFASIDYWSPRIQSNTLGVDFQMANEKMHYIFKYVKSFFRINFITCWVCVTVEHTYVNAYNSWDVDHGFYDNWTRLTFLWEHLTFSHHIRPSTLTSTWLQDAHLDLAYDKDPDVLFEKYGEGEILNVEDPWGILSRGSPTSRSWLSSEYSW